MKKIVLLGMILFSVPKVQACIDCSGSGTTITFIGTVTANAFVGPTITTITQNIAALSASTASMNLTAANSNYIQNTSSLQNGATFYVSSGTALNFTAASATIPVVSASTLQLRGVSYNPPSADGTNGQALTTNGSAGLSWATISGGGGGGGAQISTLTYALRATGDVYLSTYPGANLSHFYTRVGTFNITSAWGYNLYGSTAGYTTCTSTYAVVISTDQTGRGIIWTGIDASSWTVRYDSGLSPDKHAPSTTSRILPDRHLYMFNMTDHQNCGGTPPGGEWGVGISGWWEP